MSTITQLQAAEVKFNTCYVEQCPPPNSPPPRTSGPYLEMCHWLRWGHTGFKWPKEKTGLPWWLSGKESACQCKRHGFDPWTRKIPRAMEQLSLCTAMVHVQIWGCALDLRSCSYGARVPRAYHAQQQRSHHSEKLPHRNWRVAPTREKLVQQQRTQRSQKQFINLKNSKILWGYGVLGKRGRETDREK